MSVSVQYEHLHAVLHNPFFVSLCIGLSVGQCEETIRREFFSPHNRLKWVHNPLLNFSVHGKVDQIANMNALT